LSRVKFDVHAHDALVEHDPLVQGLGAAATQCNQGTAAACDWTPSIPWAIVARSAHAPSRTGRRLVTAKEFP
jgi:hypothetical protein